MANCLNCKTKLSCGCKKRTAQDGTSCCVKCIKTYEAKLANKTKNNSGALKDYYNGKKSPGVVLKATVKQTD